MDFRDFFFPPREPFLRRPPPPLDSEVLIPEDCEEFEDFFVSFLRFLGSSFVENRSSFGLIAFSSKRTLEVDLARPLLLMADLARLLDGSRLDKVDAPLDLDEVEAIVGSSAA